MNADQKIEKFKTFLENNQILIVDKSSASRRRLTKTLIDLGGKRNQVHSVAHYSEAIDVVKTKKPGLVLSDYELNGGSGFDLFKEFRITHPEDKKSTLILITSNISQSAVAKAAEEDVDSFIIKPYTVKSLEKSLISAVINKLFPSEYVKTIEAGKVLMFDGKYEESMAKFAEAIGLNKKPALAHFYHGQAKYFVESTDEAQGDYKKGLTFNSIHFKCQVGLYELFMKEKKHYEAYDVIKNIAKYFPANPDRLQEVVRLAMLTKNYDDMEAFYDIFINLDERPIEAINYICAGLYITGKYNFLEGNVEKGRDIFEKVGISCAGMTKFLKAMIVLLVEYDIHDDAKRLVGRFPTGENNNADYAIATYLASSADMEVTERVSRGLELFNNNYKDPNAVRIMIKALREIGSDKKAQEYQEEANHLWPDLFSLEKLAS